MAMIKRAQQASRTQKQRRAAAGRMRRQQAARRMRAARRPDEPPPPMLSAEPAPTELVEPERFLQARLIFDQRLNNLTYTAPELGELLGSPDLLEFFFYLDGPQGFPAANLQLEHSPDGVNWEVYFPYWLDGVSFSANTLYRFNTSGLALASGLRRLLVGVTGGFARARLWVTSRGSGQRRFSELVFDEQMNTGGTTYSDSRLAMLMASADKLQLFVIVTDTSGTTPTLTVQLEEGPDGIFWKNKQTTAEINAAALTVGARTILLAQDDGSQPTSAYLRLRIAMGGSSGTCHVLIYATGRGQ